VIFTSLDNSSGPNISLNTATGKMTLAAGSTYRIRGAVPNYSGGQRPAFMWYNETASAYMGNGTYSYNPGDGASLGAFGTTAEVIISPNVSTDISFRLVSSLSSGSVIVGGNGDFNTAGSYPWCEVQLISGNAPVTLINFGDIKTGIQSGDHNGWVKLDGRLKSALSGTQQAQATSLGIGANLPDATNAFLVQNGST